MDSTAQTAPRDSDIIIELLSRVTLDATAQTATRDSEIIDQTAVKGDTWIQQPRQPLGTQKSATTLRPQVTLGLDSSHSP